jgi:uncharacterized membrane protein
MEVHPLIVHVPIALSLAAALLYFLSQLLGNDALRAAALWNLDLAALGGIAAVLSGLWAEEAAEAAGLSPTAHELLETHGALGYAAGGMLAGTAILRRVVPEFRQHFAPVYLALIILSAALIGVNGYLGGRMVFTEGVGVRASQIYRPPAQENAEKGGQTSENEKIPKDNSGGENPD